MKTKHVKGISMPRCADKGSNIDDCFAKLEPIVGPNKADLKCSAIFSR